MRCGRYWIFSEFCYWKWQKIGFGREKELRVITLGTNNIGYVNYPWRKVVCFVLSWWDLLNHNVLGYVMGLIIKKLSMNKGAHIWCRMFGITKWKLSIIESFFHWKLNKTKIENYIGIWGCYWYCWKTLTKSNFIEFET